jgi:hypothetical protein
VWSPVLAQVRSVVVTDSGPAGVVITAWWWGGVSSRIVAPPRVRILVPVLSARRSGSGAATSGAVRADQERSPGRGFVDPGLADRHHVHRRTVRQALESAVPPPRKAYPQRPSPAVDAYAAVIDGWLIADKQVPRKQQAPR